MGIHLVKPILLCMDATAGMGVASRRGAGRIRHISTPTLWLQRAVNDGRVRLQKVLGKGNPADLGTKHEDKDTIDRMLAKCSLVKLEGRSKQALEACLK